MSYPESIRVSEISKAEKCAICQDPFPPGSYAEFHSATSLHLVRDKSTNKYIVTDPPLGHENLKGKTILWDPTYYEETDGFALCPVCHDEVHRIARAEAHLNDFPGNAPPPGILEEVTLFFVQRGKPIVVSLFTD